MEPGESSMVSDNIRQAGLESQILNSQEIIVRLNRELDSALLRITTLETVCFDHQNDLHEKRSRIQQLNDEMIEREESNDRLCQELQEKDERLKTLDDLISQLKEHIKQAKHETEDEDEKEQHIDSHNIQSQITFDEQLRQLILHELDDDSSPDSSPQAILERYHQNERLKFHNLLQQSLTTEDISNLIDSDDILFESLTHLNSLSRLKDTLSRDSQHLQRIRSLLHLTTDNYAEAIKDLINQRECMEYLHTKIDPNHDLTDFDLVKSVLHDYFNFQQQQSDLKEYLQLNNDHDNEMNYTRHLIERCSEAMHMEVELTARIKTYEQTIEQLNEAMKERQEIDDLVSKFNHRSTSEVSQVDRIRTILQANVDFQETLCSELSVTSIEDVLPRLREYKSVYENRPTSTEINHHHDQLTKEIEELKEERNDTKKQFKELTNLLGSDNDDESSILEPMHFDHIHSFLQSTIRFRQTLSKKLSVVDNHDSILQRIDDYQLIIHQLDAHENTWTKETTDGLIHKLKTMESAADTIEDLRNQLDEAMDNEKQLQTDIEEIADEFTPKTTDQQKSNLTRIYQTLQSLADFRQAIVDKTQMNTDEDILQALRTYREQHDVALQTTDNDEFYLRVKEIIGMEEDNPEELINKIKEFSQLPSPTQINELFSSHEKLRNLLNIGDDNLLDSVMNLNTSYLQLKEEYDVLVKKDDSLDKSIERLMQKLGLSSDTSLRTRIDEICAMFDTFCLAYCQLTLTEIESMTLMKLFKHMPLIVQENQRLKELIDQIDFDKSLKGLDYVSKLQTYTAKVAALCQLICNDHVNAEQALIVYEEQSEHHRTTMNTIADFKQQLLTQLSIDDEEQIFDRLNELDQMTTDLKVKLHTTIASTGTLTSLNATISEQHHKILEHEESLEKLRTQRERMLNKMREMKTNNETLTNQLEQVNQSLDEQHRNEIDYKNQIEALEQQLRSVRSQIQVTLDECQSQQDLQETMKLEITSIQQENDTQRKLYESRCRQIIQEKNQLEKTKKDLIEQKQILEDENKRCQTILQTIKDTLENVNDSHSIVDAILKLRQDQMTLTSELDRRNEHVSRENESLLLNMHQQQSTMSEYIQMKSELEKRLFDNEQQVRNFQQELKVKDEHYEHLQNEYRLYKEDHQMKISSQVAVIDIEQSSPPPPPQTHLSTVQQAAQSNRWMAIDMKDDEVPLTTTNKHASIDPSTALFNLLGELKSKLGITLTHRPRSSSVYFLYLCAVHLLTIYLLFIRRC